MEDFLIVLMLNLGVASNSIKIFFKKLNSKKAAALGRLCTAGSALAKFGHFSALFFEDDPEVVRAAF